MAYVANKYFVEHLFIQIDVRCFVSKEFKSALTYMLSHLFDTIYNLLRLMILLAFSFFFWQEYKLSFRVAGQRLR